MTWQELLNEGEKRLSKKGVPEAKLNAWYLFSDCFETSKSGFFLNQELETESEKTERFLALIAKRVRADSARISVRRNGVYGTSVFGQ